jgi:hypothetical protein
MVEIMYTELSREKTFYGSVEKVLGNFATW